MTCIAYRAGVISADTMISSNSALYGHSRKIAQNGKLLAGACGGSVLCRAFLDWFNRGMKGHPPRMKGDGITATGAVFYDTSRFIVVDQDGINDLHMPFFAMGSGGAYAKGALASGCTPQEAVEIAARFDHFTGGAIETMSADPLAMVRLREQLSQRPALRLVA